MSRPALVLSDVSAAYGREPVLEGVTGRIEPGGSLALIGPNGAGKSTLIKAILGLVPLPSGSIEVLGQAPARARSQVAYVPQAEALDRNFPVSALQVVLMGRYRRVGWLRRPGAADKAAARAALDRVGLADRGDTRFGTLSGGQRQRVLMARAIAQEARLLLLDEPFNGVDTTSTDLLLDVLDALRNDGVAVVMATHDLSIAHLACGDACLINHHQVAFGPIDEALTAERLQQTYGARAVVLAGGSTIVTA
ncbi:MAG TPA: metal ABC transporter ATP-binding protein [Acidimicrobiales bacterium]|nr:metal ABC transporter ATP-binding protein [Acidimicrobiales bacterium]